MNRLEQVVARDRKLSARTKQLYGQAVREFANYAGSDADWNKKTAQDFYTTLLRRMRPQSANTMISGLRFATKRLKLDFVDDIELKIGKPTRKRRTLTHEEARQLLQTCVGTRPIDVRDRALLALGLLTGLRRSALVAIDCRDLRTGHVKATLKGGREHKVPISPTLHNVIEAWRTWLAAHGIAKGPLFRSISRSHIDETITIGSRLTPNGLYTALLRRAEQAGVKRVRPDIFVATFTAWCKEFGLSREQINAVTGYGDGKDKEHGCLLALEAFASRIGL